MFEIKPMTSYDHFVHPAQTARKAYDQSHQGAHQQTIVTISAAAHQMLKAELPRSFKAPETFKEKVKKILNYDFNENMSFQDNSFEAAHDTSNTEDDYRRNR